MPKHATLTFQEILDIIEALPDEQQASLIDIIRRRLIDYRREKLADRIREARAEYAKGEARSGTVDDLMKEISE